jgi:hypothetical protein
VEAACFSKISKLTLVSLEVKSKKDWGEKEGKGGIFYLSKP